MIPQPVRELMPVRLKDPTMLHRFLRTGACNGSIVKKYFATTTPALQGSWDDLVETQRWAVLVTSSLGERHRRAVLFHVFT